MDEEQVLDGLPGEDRSQEELEIEVDGAIRKITLSLLPNGKSALRMDGRTLTAPIAPDENIRHVTVEGRAWEIRRSESGRLELRPKTSVVSSVTSTAARVSKRVALMVTAALGEVDLSTPVRLPEGIRSRLPDWIPRLAPSLALLVLPLVLGLGSCGMALFVGSASSQSVQRAVEELGPSARPEAEKVDAVFAEVAKSSFAIGIISLLMIPGLVLYLAGRSEGLSFIEVLVIFATFVAIEGAVSADRLLHALFVERDLPDVPAHFHVAGAGWILATTIALGVVLALTEMLRTAADASPDPPTSDGSRSIVAGSGIVPAQLDE